MFANDRSHNYVENPAYWPPEKLAKPETQNWIKNKVTVQRLVKGWEQSRLVVFLASDDSDFICGEVIRFAGGVNVPVAPVGNPETLRETLGSARLNTHEQLESLVWRGRGQQTRMLRESLSAPSKATVKRAKTSETRTQVYGAVDRDRRRAVRQIERLSEKLVLTEPVTERATKIYMKAFDRGLVKGRSIHGIMAASLYAACRERQTPVRLKDVAVVCNVEKKDIARCYRLLLKEMDFKMPVANPAKYVSVIASRAGISRKTMRRASGILKKADKAGISAGKDPAGLAAAALLVASSLEREDRLPKDLEKAAGVTEVTIRHRYKDLRKILA